MKKTLFKTKSIQFGVLYSNLVSKLKDARNDLTYSRYMKLIQAERAVRSYSDQCFTAFSNDQLNMAREVSGKDQMITDLIKRNHRLVTSIGHLKSRVKNSNDVSTITKKAARLSDSLESYKKRIERIRNNYAHYKADNIKKISRYKRLLRSRKLRDAQQQKSVPKQQPVDHNPFSANQSSQKSQIQIPQNPNPNFTPVTSNSSENSSLQSSASASANIEANNLVNSSSVNANEQSDSAVRRRQQARQQANSSQNTPKTRKANKRHKSSKDKHSDKSSSDNSIYAYARKNYNLDSDSVDKIINQAKHKLYTSDSKNSDATDATNSDSGSDNSDDTSDNSDSSDNSSDNQESDSSSSEGPKIG